jgi:hypothetical protein
VLAHSGKRLGQQVEAFVLFDPPNAEEYDRLASCRRGADPHAIGKSRERIDDLEIERVGDRGDPLVADVEVTPDDGDESTIGRDHRVR